MWIVYLVANRLRTIWAFGRRETSSSRVPPPFEKSTLAVAPKPVLYSRTGSRSLPSETGFAPVPSHSPVCGPKTATTLVPSASASPANPLRYPQISTIHLFYFLFFQIDFHCQRRATRYLTYFRFLQIILYYFVSLKHRIWNIILLIQLFKYYIQICWNEITYYFTIVAMPIINTKQIILQANIWVLIYFLLSIFQSCLIYKFGLQN
jgi:hypothetical protein